MAEFMAKRSDLKHNRHPNTTPQPVPENRSVTPDGGRLKRGMLAYAGPALHLSAPVQRAAKSQPADASSEEIAQASIQRAGGSPEFSQERKKGSEWTQCQEKVR